MLLTPFTSIVHIDVLFKIGLSWSENWFLLECWLVAVVFVEVVFGDLVFILND